VCLSINMWFLICIQISSLLFFTHSYFYHFLLFALPMELAFNYIDDFPFIKLSTR
ncbi:Unknown protein, partial [Striga hermonthica]